MCPLIIMHRGQKYQCTPKEAKKIVEPDPIFPPYNPMVNNVNDFQFPEPNPDTLDIITIECEMNFEDSLETSFDPFDQLFI